MPTEFSSKIAWVQTIRRLRIQKSGISFSCVDRDLASDGQFVKPMMDSEKQQGTTEKGSSSRRYWGVCRQAQHKVLREAGIDELWQKLISDVDPASKMIFRPPAVIVGRVFHSFVSPAEKGRCLVTDGANSWTSPKKFHCRSGTRECLS